MQLVVVIAACAILSALLAPKVMAYCIQRGWVDAPRRDGYKPPKGGGLGIVLVSLPIATALTLATPSLTHHTFLLAMLGGGLLVAAGGWLEDQRLMPVWGKFAVQLLAIALALYFLPPVFDSIMFWADRAILLVGWWWFINLYNFMDAIDGQAAAEAVIVAVAVALVFQHSGSVMLPLAGAALGFLTVNKPKAKIYLGRVGSSYLGYVLAGGMLTASAANVDHMIPALIAALYFIADATYTSLKRMIKGERFWEASDAFWFRRAYQQGLSHKQILWGMLKLSAALLLIAYWTVHYHWGWYGLLAALVPLAFVAMKILHLEGSGK